MASRNYQSIRQVRESIDYDLDQWAASRETSLAVAAAIHALADSERTPDQIWQAPTQNEWINVPLAVAEYVAHGDVKAGDDGRYCWGEERIELPRYTIAPIGGTMWAVDRDGERVGTVDAGKIDDSGQWIGDEDDVLAAATAGDFPLVQADGLPVYVDGALVREG